MLPENHFMHSKQNNEKNAVALINTELSTSLIHDEHHELLKLAITHIDNLLVRLNQQQIELFFHVLCDIKEIKDEDRQAMFSVFALSNEALIIDCVYYEKTSKSKIELLFEQFNLEHILKNTRRRDANFSGINRERIIHFLHSLKNVKSNEPAENQDADIQKTFRIIKYQLMALLNNLPVNALCHHVQLSPILDEAFNLHKQNISEVTHIIANIKHNHLMTVDMENEWNDSVTNHHHTPLNSNIIHTFTRDIYYGLLQANHDVFFQGMDAYIDYYLKKESKNRKNQRLLLDDQIEAFYSPYYASLQNLWDSSLINALLHYYDTDLFFAFMQRYDIDFTIPVSFQGQYLSLAEFACYHKINLIDDMVERKMDLWSAFSHKIIVQKEISHIKYEPFHFNICYNQDTVCKMISKGMITHEMIFDRTNIFYTLLNKEYYHAFCLLYQITKQNYPDFSLKTLSESQPHQDLLSLYLSSKGKNSDVLTIFVQEKFNLLHENRDQTRALDFIIQQTHSHTIELVNTLLPLFPEEYKQPYQLLMNKPDDFPLNNPEDTSQFLVSWYDEHKLLKHIENSTGAKVNFLQKMADAHHSRKPTVSVTDESFFEDLLDKHPNFSDIIDFYKGQFRQCYYGNKSRVSPVLLLGEPGIGKTHFAKQLAAHLKSGYGFIDMASITANWVLNGASGSWQDAKQGKIIDIMMHSPTVNPVVVLDELDKVNGSKYDATGTLYQLLEEINAKEFTDEFLDFSFDVSGMIYIASANTLQGISEPLLSRFKVFHVQGPDTTQLRQIIGHIYQESVSDNTLMNPILNPDAIQMLESNSLREIKIQLEEGISRAMLSYSRAQLDNLLSQGRQITLLPEHLREKTQKTKMGF
jgi:hypothetical protein